MPDPHRLIQPTDTILLCHISIGDRAVLFRSVPCFDTTQSRTE